MIEWIITSSVLILIIVALRYFLKGKISLRLQYGLWALVLIRLLIPFSVGSSSISILNFTDRIAEDRIEALYEEMLPDENARDAQNGKTPGENEGDVQTGEVPGMSQVVTPITPGKDDVISSDNETQGVVTPSFPVTGNDGVSIDKIIPDVSVQDKDVVDITSSHTLPGTVMPGTTIPGDVTDSPVADEPSDNTALPIGDILRKAVLYTWLAGIVLVGGYLLFVNMHFTYGLKKNAKRLPEIKGYPLSVYFAENIDTPCMHGLIRPAVYVTEEAMANEKVLRHVLEHETTHYRHGDHVWSVLRSVCLALHWYNPFVWLAALLSRNDAELACDEGTINRIGEAEREEYGRTLIGLTCQKKNGLFVTATTMTGSKKSIKERIVLIAKKPKMAIYTLVAVLLIATVAIGCTFTGARGKEETTTESGDNNEDETTTGEKEPTTTGNEDANQEVVPVIKGGISADRDYLFGVDSTGKVLINTTDTVRGVDKDIISQWENLVSVDIGREPYEYGVVGLKEDGTVYTWNYNLNGWTDIVQISVSDSEVIGLKKDGTVLSKGTVNMSKANWKDIVQVSAGNGFLVGLKADKTVVAVGDNTYGQCAVSNWTDIEMIAAGDSHTVGLRSDGTVLVAGLNLFGENDVASWRNIVFVAAGDFVTIGIKNTGKIVATGRNIESYSDDIGLWSNMAYVTSGDGVIAGVTRDGQTVISSIYDFTEADFSNIRIPETGVVIDNKKELPVVEQKYADTEIIGKDLSVPVNGIIQTDNGLGLVIPMEIADKVYYKINDYVDTDIDIYLRSDMDARVKDGNVICDYARLGIFEKVSIAEAAQILKTPIVPTLVVGGDAVENYVMECENPDAEEGFVYLFYVPTDVQIIRVENLEEYGEVGKLIKDNMANIKPLIITANKDNKAVEVETIVMAMFDNTEFPISVEKSLGKGLQNEVFYAEEYPISNHHLDLDFKALLGHNSWYEVTETEKIKQIETALDFGFIRLLNDNKEEFIVLKSVNAVAYKTADGVRYFSYIRKTEDATDYSYLSYAYDWFAFDMRLARLAIDDDPSKTREELAYDMMEAYRVCGMSLLPDNTLYFDELKIIHLESYDESDSNPETLIGIITEDVLRFWVKYAINTKGLGAAGSWDYGEGEYEGYMTNSFDVGAERIDGKWYCFRMGNG